MKSIATISIPQDSVSDEAVIIVSLARTHGEHLSKGDLVLDYETSKSVTSLEAPVSGHIVYRCLESAAVAIGEVVAEFFDTWDENDVPPPQPSSVRSPEPSTKSAPVAESIGVTQFSIRAEELLAQHGLNKRIFEGRDLVSAHDVEEVLARISQAPSFAPSKSKPGDGERVVVVCANQISAEMLEDIVADDPSTTIVGYVADPVYRKLADLPYLDCGVFEFPEKVSRETFDSVVIAMGGSLKSMRFRKKVFEHYRTLKMPFTNLIAQTAKISTGVKLGTGNVIEGNVFIGPHARITDNNFISYSTVIGHHNQIGSHNLFAPGVTMAGLVSIGDECILPTGVNFIDQVTIGNRVIVPVGYNITSDMRDDTVIKFRSAN